MVRLVKGAYWDTEIKRAQERGLDDYPVFTRKAMTDLNYIACAQKLLALRPRIFPQFATHNALTVATILELAGGESGFEFQRLHGMGEALYAQLSRGSPGTRLPHLCAGRQPPRSAGLSGAAAAGERRQFVLRGARRRRHGAGGDAAAASGRRSSARPTMRGIRTSRCRAISTGRSARNSRGIEFGERAALDRLVCGASPRQATPQAGASIADADAGSTRTRRDRRRARGLQALEPDAGATRAPQSWRRPPICWSSARAHFIALLQREGGKTLDDALSEVREAADFCRYYAARRPQAVRRRRSDAGPDRREQCAAAARPRRVRRDLAVEFSAGDLSGPGHGGADGRQCGGRKARRTDAADRGRGRPAAA